MKKLSLSELGRLTPEAYRSAEKIPVVVVLDNIRSGLNVGSIFRTSDAFLVEKICLCGITAQPPHKEILKTAIGASETVDWEYFNHISNCFLSLANYELIGIEQTNQSIKLPLFGVDVTKKYALVFGNEVNGLTTEILRRLDAAIEIPQFGTKHSLNIAVCAGIVLWHFAEPFMTKQFS